MMRFSVVRARAVVPLLIGALALSPARHLAAQEAVAVIVHPSNPLQTVSLDELRRLYLGTSTTMPNRETVVLLESPEVRERFYAAVLRMKPDRVKRHWIGVVFSGESGVPPREVGNATEVVRYVARHPGAIAFLPSGAVGPGVKTLMVQGLNPAAPNYPIR